MPLSLTRRALLRAVLVGGAATALVGCDSEVRPGRPVPEPPVRADDPATWPVDSELLVAVRGQVHDTISRSLQISRPGGLLREIQGHWRTQLTTLEDLISSGGVPLPELPALPEPAPEPTGDDAASTSSAPAGADDASVTTGPPGISQKELGVELRDGLPALIEQISTASSTNLPMLVSLTSHRAAAAQILRAAYPWEPLAGPEGAAAVPLLAATRPAIFGLEVVSARSSGEEREDYERVLDEIRSLTRQLTSLAGAAAPVAPLGYDLPEPLTEESHRRQLALDLVSDIAPAALRSADRVLGRPEHLTSLVRIAAESVAWSRSFKGPFDPFPGMTLP